MILADPWKILHNINNNSLECFWALTAFSSMNWYFLHKTHWLRYRGDTDDKWSVRVYNSDLIIAVLRHQNNDFHVGYIIDGYKCPNFLPPSQSFVNILSPIFPRCQFYGLAGNAPMQGHLSMGLQEVLTVLQERPQPAIESDTLQRVVDSGYKKGTGRQERFSGVHRCHINQLLTGTISLPTPRWLLGWKAEHIWVCPECFEANP